MAKTFKEPDLNIRHYIGSREDILKKLKSAISEYLQHKEVPDPERTFYSSLYHGISYYQAITDRSISMESEGQTFLENVLKVINDDYKYLCDKYNPKDPTMPRVISFKGRIKSPASAIEKLIDKCREYYEDGMDFSYLNDSLRDFFGVRIVIEPPIEIKKQGKQAESDYLYMIMHDFLERKGLDRQIDGASLPTDYTFTRVNTVHEPNKLDKIIERPSKEGFSSKAMEAMKLPGRDQFYIPTSIPPEIERYHDYMKAYRLYPKFQGYQRDHFCAYPPYASTVKIPKHPKYIKPTKSLRPCLEYQFCLGDEEYHANHGIASHIVYKYYGRDADNDSLENSLDAEMLSAGTGFSRYEIPMILVTDSDTDTIRLSRFDEAMEAYHGFSFKDFFGIDYQTFLEKFDTEERDDVFAQRKKIKYDKELSDYSLVPNQRYVLVDTAREPGYFSRMVRESDPETFMRFLDKNGLLDGTISVDSPEVRERFEKPSLAALFLKMMPVSKSNLKTHDAKPDPRNKRFPDDETK